MGKKKAKTETEEIPKPETEEDEEAVAEEGETGEEEEAVTEEEEGETEEEEEGEPEEEEEGETEEEGEGETEEEGETVVTKPTANDLAGLGTSSIKKRDFGTYDKTIDALIAAAQKLPEHARKYGVSMYAQVTPFANLLDSPLSDYGFNADYLEEIYKRLVPVYNRAKFILNSATYAADAESLAGKPLFVSPTGKTLKQIQDDMHAIMQQIVKIDNKLRRNPRADIKPEEIPEMPALTDLPKRLWIGSQDKLTPPAGFDFVPSDLIDRSLETYTHFTKMAVDRQHGDFKKMCVDYCTSVNNDIRSTYVDIMGFIDDLKEGFAEMLRGSEDPKDIITELRSDLARKKSALEYRLTNRGVDFGRLEEKAKSIPRLRSLDDKDVESGSKALKFFTGTNGLNYHLRGNIGDTGGLSGFWDYMDKTFEKFAKTIELLPPKEKISNYVSFDGDKWDQLRKSYTEAGAKWQRLSAGAS
jgi:hypothetical protein